MRIGLFYQIQVPKPWTPQSESQRIYEALEQIPYAEQMGFASVWFSEHHFRPVWSHNSAPDLTLAAVSQRTSRIRLGIGVVLAPIHHPLHVAARMATLDILSHGRVDVGLGRTGYPYQLTPYGADLHDTRGMWQEFAEVLPRIWTEDVITHQGTYYQIPAREVLPKPVQRPHPPLWSACGSDETARLTGSLGMGGLFGSEGGPDRVQHLMTVYQEALQTAPGTGAHPTRRAALMTAGYCHEDPQVVAERGTAFCVGTPAECIRFLERYEALGIDEVFLLCAIGPAQHHEVLHTIRLFGEQVIPHFEAKAQRAVAAQ